MSHINCIILEDEFLAIEILIKFIKPYGDFVLLRAFTNPNEALEFIQNNNVDLVFLDIQMPFLSGFDFLHQTPYPIHVIFTTANPNFALKAFNVNAIDYLLKPFSQERFDKAIAKAKMMIKINHLQKMLSFYSNNKEIELRNGYKTVKIQSNEIIYIESESEYIRVYTETTKIFTIGSLKSVFKLLPEGFFIRIHKSYIIAFRTVKSYNSYEVELLNGIKLPIGRSYRKDFKLALASNIHSNELDS